MNKKTINLLEKVHSLFQTSGLTLSVAESCTGGLVCHQLTTMPGASTFFMSGIVAYSQDAKKKILGISTEIIKRHGVISKKTAEEMADKMRTLTKADIALSTTGNLGPDVLEGKERGLIYIAVSREGQTLSKEIRLTGDREKNKEEASYLALMFLIELIEQ